MDNMTFFLLSIGTVCLMSLIMLIALLISVNLTKGKHNG